MSVVSSIMISSSYSDELDGENMSDSGPSCIRKINIWLEENTGSKLSKANDDFGGGNKCLQFYLWAGGFNHFERYEDDFVQFFKGLPWNFPGEALLIIYPEQGDAKIFRP